MRTLLAEMLEPHLIAATPCESLSALPLLNTQITLAQSIAAGAFTPPAAPGRGRAAALPAPAGAAGQPPLAAVAQGGGLARGGGGGNQFTDLPAFCRVLGTIKTSDVSNIKFEVWMPASGWNGKFLVNGFAFYGGTMAPGPLAGALRMGYATATTDLGGNGTNGAAYMTGHPESLVDWNEAAGTRRR